MIDRARPRVVFDCNVYFQALISPGGPSGRCVTAAVGREVELFTSRHVIAELLATAQRSSLMTRFRYSTAQVVALIENIERVAHYVAEVPERFRYDRDPDDAHYINLALSVRAQYVVSRDKDLLDLVDQRRAEGRDFVNRFPMLRVIEPAELLTQLGTK